MICTVNFPIYNGCLGEYGSFESAVETMKPFGVDGLELIWGEDNYQGEIPEARFAPGYHLVFWPDWVDFWHGNEEALLRKFGSPDTVRAYYGGESRADMLRQYREDMERAARIGAKYVVLHISDVSIEEGYSYRWLHSSEEVVTAACDLLDQLTAGRKWPFRILLENQWWPGLQFTDNRLTRMALESVSGDRGLLLDTGHLMNGNSALRTEKDGIAYIHQVLDHMGSLSDEIYGMHLHQSLSGEYVESCRGVVPKLPEDYMQRYAENYGHVLKIDRHEPWTDPAIGGVIERIRPEFLTNELAAGTRKEKERVLAIQSNTLRTAGILR